MSNNNKKAKRGIWARFRFYVARQLFLGASYVVLYALDRYTLLATDAELAGLNRVIVEVLVKSGLVYRIAVPPPTTMSQEELDYVMRNAQEYGGGFRH